MLKILFYIFITANYTKPMELHSKEHFALLKRVHLKEGEG